MCVCSHIILNSLMTHQQYIHCHGFNVAATATGPVVQTTATVTPYTRQQKQIQALSSHLLSQEIKLKYGIIRQPNCPSTFVFFSGDRCIPNVYFAGFPRSGTSYLTSILNEHPQVQRVAKEPHFFTRFWRKAPSSLSSSSSSSLMINESTSSHNTNSTSFQRYLDLYRRQCLNVLKDNKTVMIDGSQSLAWQLREDGVDLVTFLFDLNPNMKLLFAVRDPLSRLLSWFFHFFDYSKYNNPREYLEANARTEIRLFEDCFDSLEAQHDSCYCAYHPPKSGVLNLHVSMYHCHLKRWREVIPLNQLLVVSYEELYEINNNNNKHDRSSSDKVVNNNSGFNKPINADDNFHSVNITILKDIFRFLSLPVSNYDYDSLKGVDSNSDNKLSSPFNITKRINTNKHKNESASIATIKMLDSFILKHERLFRILLKTE